MTTPEPRYKGTHNLESVREAIAKALPLLLTGDILPLFQSAPWTAFANKEEKSSFPHEARFALNERLYIAISMDDYFANLPAVIDDEGNEFRAYHMRFTSAFSSFSERDNYLVERFGMTLASIARLARRLTEEFGAPIYMFMRSAEARIAATCEEVLREVSNRAAAAKLRKGKPTAYIANGAVPSGIHKRTIGGKQYEVLGNGTTTVMITRVT